MEKKPQISSARSLFLKLKHAFTEWGLESSVNKNLNSRFGTYISRKDSLLTGTEFAEHFSTSEYIFKNIVDNWFSWFNNILHNLGCAKY